MNSLPPKISNLHILEQGNFHVPMFYILSEETIKNLNEEYPKILVFFQKSSIKEIIIRSASFVEDGNLKSLAGFFESSDKISLLNLKENDIQAIWDLNKKKITEDKRLYVFIQEFIDFDYSGVLFTQNFYNDEEVLLELSKSKFDITAGKKADGVLTYNKKSKEWLGHFKLAQNLKDEVVRLAVYLEDKFINGADLEVGIKDDKFYAFQLRPITRNKDEEILLKERKRLSFEFKNDFEKQVWVKNDFTNAMKDISLTSLNFYNYLFSSEEFLNLLKEAKFTDAKGIQNLKILENIGNRTFFNLTEAQKIFSLKTSFFSKFKEILLIKSHEPILQKLNKEELDKELSIEKIFAWLYLAGNYFQFFVSQDRNLFKKDFNERLKNTESFTNATEVFLRDLKCFDEFIIKYPYLSENPYALEAKRVAEMEREEVINLFYNEEKTNEGENGKTLSKETNYWLMQKIYWKNRFLREIYKERKNLLEEFKIKEVNFKSYLSSKYSIITGKNYPFLNQLSKSEIVVVPGEIDLKNILLVGENDDFNFKGKYIAIESFPNKWIRYIPLLKGIITAEGNQLSHMAITCREYSVPYLISFHKFKKIKDSVSKYTVL